MANNTGKLLEIKGVVIDAVFTGKLPEIYSALSIERPDGGTLIAEVQQHLGDDRVRAVAMDSTKSQAEASFSIRPTRTWRTPTNSTAGGV